MQQPFVPMSMSLPSELKTHQKRFTGNMTDDTETCFSALKGRNIQYRLFITYTPTLAAVLSLQRHIRICYCFASPSHINKQTNKKTLLSQTGGLGTHTGIVTVHSAEPSSSSALERCAGSHSINVTRICEVKTRSMLPTPISRTRQTGSL